jgi:hypothetical protein
MSKKAEETLSIYSKGFVIDGTFIDFTSTKPIDMDEENVINFLVRVGKKLEELNKQHHTQQ